MLKPYSRAELSFSLDNEIGHEGKNSQVYMAHDPQLDADLVYKKIQKSDFSGRDEYFVESGVLYQSSHPNVVPIHYSCEDDDNVYIAMPYYSNGSLNQLINNRFLTVREIIRYASQFISGLHNIHSKRLIHFDVKPDNILISDQGEALLSDFGLTKQMALNGYVGQDRMYGKMAPPEAYVKAEYTTAFDIYQTGLTLYRMCVGNEEFYHQFNTYGDQANFDRDSFKFDVTNGRFPDRNNFPPHIPRRLINVVKKCLNPDPDERYTAAIHIVNDLAVIDGNTLDWQYSHTDEGICKWSKVSDDREYELIINVDGTSAAKKIFDTGREQRIRDCCQDKMTDRDVRRFLGGY